jgi:hypothetical protein
MNGFGRRINLNQQLRTKMPSRPHAVGLKCHPESNNRAVRVIEASVCWMGGQALDINYILKGDLTELRVPPLGPPRRADLLWKHTCFEAFVSVKGKADYHEFNFAPSGEWAAYSFQHYRDGTPLNDDKLVQKITVRNEADQLDLDATIRLDLLPTIPSHAWLYLALCAVIEDQSGKLSYWALRHPPGKPDFHHPDGFALDLEPAGVAAVNEPAMEK